jgi:hypothetical protein
MMQLTSVEETLRAIDDEASIGGPGFLAGCNPVARPWFDAFDVDQRSGQNARLG